MFTLPELQNIVALINRVNLTGTEAVTVAMLIQKTNGLIANYAPEVETVEAEKVAE